jgi:hypothetical protein
MYFPFEDVSVIPDPAPPILSEDIQQVIGFAIVDRAFHDLLLSNPRKALARIGLSPRDRKAAIAVQGAQSLAEYAVRLEQRLARTDGRRDVAVSRRPGHQRRLERAAS